MTYLGIDIGGTNIRIGIGSGLTNWKNFQETSLDNLRNIDDIILILENTLNKWNASRSTFKGIGVSVAGLVDNNKIIRIAENLGWHNVSLANLLETKFKKKVFVETDVFCGAFFVSKSAEVEKLNSALYVAIGTGIGHAFIINGKVWKGSNNNANAMGHFVVTQNGTNCYCGLKDCLCMVASGKAQSVNNPPKGAIEALSKTLGNSITLMEPKIIILSGGGLNLPWFNIDEIKKCIKHYIYPGITLPTIIANYNNDLNLRGAALLAKEMNV